MEAIHGKSLFSQMKDALTSGTWKKQEAEATQSPTPSPAKTRTTKKPEIPGTRPTVRALSDVNVPPRRSGDRRDWMTEHEERTGQR